METRVLLPYRKARESNLGAARLPRSRDFFASRQEKAIFTSCNRKAGLRHVEVERLPRYRVLFYFLVEDGFYFLL